MPICKKAKAVPGESTSAEKRRELIHLVQSGVGPLSACVRVGLDYQKGRRILVERKILDDSGYVAEVAA